MKTVVTTLSFIVASFLVIAGVGCAFDDSALNSFAVSADGGGNGGNGGTGNGGGGNVGGSGGGTSLDSRIQPPPDGGGTDQIVADMGGWVSPPYAGGTRWVPTADVQCDPSYDRVGQACPPGQECAVTEWSYLSIKTHCETDWTTSMSLPYKSECKGSDPPTCIVGTGCYANSKLTSGHCFRPCRCVDGISGCMEDYLSGTMLIPLTKKCAAGDTPSGGSGIGYMTW